MILIIENLIAPDCKIYTVKPVEKCKLAFSLILPRLYACLGTIHKHLKGEPGAKNLYCEYFPPPLPFRPQKIPGPPFLP